MHRKMLKDGEWTLMKHKMDMKNGLNDITHGECFFFYSEDWFAEDPEKPADE